MNLKEYIHNAKFEDVWWELYHLYHDVKKNKDGYEKVWNELKNLPVDDEYKNTQIEVYFVHNDEEPCDDYFGVHGKEEGEQVDSCFSYVSWEKVLGMSMDEQTVIKYPKEFVIALVIYDITWGGFSQEDIQKHTESWTKDEMEDEENE